MCDNWNILSRSYDELSYCPKYIIGGDELSSVGQSFSPLEMMGPAGRIRLGY